MVSPVARRYTRVVNGSLVVCLSEYLPLHSVHIYILAIKVQGFVSRRAGIFLVKGKSCSRRRQFRFTPFPRMWRVGIGRDRVLVFGFSGVMISMKSIDLHIGHGRSVRVYFAKRLRIYRIGKTPWLASCLSVPR